MDEIKKLKETREKLIGDISKKDLYEDQFNRLQSKYDKLMQNHKDLVHKSNQTDLDKTELEVELEELQKEIDSTKKQLEDTKKSIPDPKLLEESRQHVKELSAQLNQKEKELKGKVGELKDALKEIKDLRNIINKNEEEFKQKLEKQKTEYEKKLERQKEPLTPQELKAIGNALEEIDKETFKSRNYEEVLEKLKSRKQKYKEIAENNRVKPNKRYFYEKLSESVDYRIDFIRIVMGDAVDTNRGRDVLERVRRANMWWFQRMYEKAKDNKYGILGWVLSNIFSGIMSIIVWGIYVTAEKGTKVIKDHVAPTLIQGAANLGIDSLKNALLAIPKFLLWIADNIVQFIIGAISASIFLYKEYGEEATFPIFAFWCYILAMGMVGLHYLQYTYEKVQSYNPFS